MALRAAGCLTKAAGSPGHEGGIKEKGDPSMLIYGITMVWLFRSTWHFYDRLTGHHPTETFGQKRGGKA